MIRVPKNIILTNQYTSGGEFYIKNTNETYKGYYFLINEKAFSGKEPGSDSKALEKLTDKLPGPSDRKDGNIPRYLFQPTKEEIQKGETIRYFAKKIKEVPVRIIEINKETYDSIQNNPGYKSISLPWSFVYSNQSKIDAAEKSFSGIRFYLRDLNISDVFDEDRYKLKDS